MNTKEPIQFDIYPLLTVEKLELISEIFSDALNAQNVYPELWDMQLTATVYDQFDPEDVTWLLT